MDSSDMKVISEIYNKILKRCRYDYNMGSDDIESACLLETDHMHLNEINDQISSILKVSKDFANECLARATEIRESVMLLDKYKHEQHPELKVEKELYKNLNWHDKTEIEDNKKNILECVDKIIENDNKKEICNKPTKKIYKNISDIYNIKINFNYEIPVVNSISEIQPSLYWFGGDKTHIMGVYTCVTPGVYIQVPFPNVIDGSKEYNRLSSFKCKYNTKIECDKIQNILSTKYNSAIRICNFAHVGEKYNKVGAHTRCPGVPRFGNHNSINVDLDDVLESDIKLMLMHSLSDTLLSSLWFQKQKTKQSVLTNIDIC